MSEFEGVCWRSECRNGCYYKGVCSLPSRASTKCPVCDGHRQAADEADEKTANDREASS